MSRTGHGFLRNLRRAVTSHRRLLAAGLAAASVAFALSALHPEPPRTTEILVAAHDLSAGATLTESDVRQAAVPPTAVPDGAFSDGDTVAGRVLAAPMRRGEPLTDVRLVGAASLHGYGKGKVGTPVRIADPGVAALLHPGSVVDVLAVPTAEGLEAAGSTEVVAERVRVVSVPTARDRPGGRGTLVVLATTPKQATRLAHAASTARLSVSLHTA